jgi:hypothetical protein
MTELDHNPLVRRAAAALRAPHARDDAAKAAVVHAVHVEAASHWAGRAMSLPWWTLIIAATIAVLGAFVSTPTR